MERRDTIQYERLYDNLFNHFNREDLKTLCYIRLGIDSEIFSSEDKMTIVRELIDYCEKACKIEALLASAKKFKPEIDWPDISEFTSAAAPQECETRTEYEIAIDRQREDALQRYLDQIELLLEKGLRGSEKEAEVRVIARTRTLAVLRGLDGERKGMVVKFLYEAGLIFPDAIVDLNGANLSGANLNKAKLGGANLNRANLIEARMMDAELGGANLDGANLIGANLDRANLCEAHLEMANLKDADLSGSNLNKAFLARAVLLKADLIGTKLCEATLTGANLNRTNLSGAKLSEAILNQARLQVANLVEANLVEADLTGADLFRADLSGASLNGTNLLGANLCEANVTDDQLSKAKFITNATLPNGSKHTDPPPNPSPDSTALSDGEPGTETPEP